MNLNYQTGIPNRPNKPTNDQPQMTINNDSVNSWVAIDHVGFNTSNSTGGYHKVIRQTLGSPGRTRSGVGATQANFPANILGINQVFSANYTPDYVGAVADTQLFAKTGSSGATNFSQLTGNQAASEGWAWMGGMLIQWGFVTAVIGNLGPTALTFNSRTNCIPFPNSLFNVTATPAYLDNASKPANNSNATIAIQTTAFSKNGFSWISRSPSASYTGFYWMAIGN